MRAARFGVRTSDRSRLALTVQTAVRFRPVQAVFGSGAKLTVSPLAKLPFASRSGATTATAWD